MLFLISSQFWLSLTFCPLVISFVIDDSCQAYKGNDISRDIREALTEVQQMAANAVNRFRQDSLETYHLRENLFGLNETKWEIVENYFIHLTYFSPNANFVIVCDEYNVLPPSSPAGAIPDPRGLWVNRAHNWYEPYDKFVPCDPARSTHSAAGGGYPRSYTMFERRIFLCSYLLDMAKGRSIVPYKNQVLINGRLDDYIITPVAIMHELLHTNLTGPARKSSSGSQHCRIF